MSSWFKFEISVKDFVLHKQNDIIDAARNEWDFDVVRADEHVTTLYLSGEGQTSADPGGKIDEIAAAIWKANGKYCALEIQEVCLDILPWQYHARNEEDYKKLVAT